MKDATPLQPVYLTLPIAGVVRNSILTWYIAPKEVWFMDRTELEIPDMAATGPPTVDQRFGIAILDENSVALFQEYMTPYAVSLEMLRAMIAGADDWGEYPGNYAPALIVEFDTKQLRSYYQEVGGEFQDFVPKGWQARFEIAVPQHIPPPDKYWIIDGEDLLKKNLPFA